MNGDETDSDYLDDLEVFLLLTWTWVVQSEAYTYVVRVFWRPRRGA